MTPAGIVLIGVGVLISSAFVAASLIGRRLADSAASQSIEAPEGFDPVPVSLRAVLTGLDISEIHAAQAHGVEHGGDRLHHRQSVHVVAAGFHDRDHAAPAATAH